MPDFFIDSCVFFAYAYPHEFWHSKCRDFFDGKYQRFTGIRVKTEIGKKLQKRRLLYIDLVNHLERGRSPKEFTASVGMNPNDRLHFEDLLNKLDGSSASDILTFFREKDNITRKGINEALAKIKSPLIQLANDPVCVSVLQVFMVNKSDAEILVDAICWSEKVNSGVFATLDKTDFINNRGMIVNKIRKYKMIEPSELFPFEIKHMGEIL